MKFVLPLPPTLNATYKIGKYRNMYKDKKAKDWEKEAGYLIIKQKGKSKIIDDKCWINIKMYVTYDRDIDSCLKILLDTLERQGVFTNDRIIRRLTIMKIKVKVNPRLEIEVGQNGKKTY